MENKRPGVTNAGRWYGTEPFVAPRKPGQARGIIPVERAAVITDRKPVAPPERIRFDVPLERQQAVAPRLPNSGDWQDTASTKQLITALGARVVPGSKKAGDAFKNGLVHTAPFAAKVLKSAQPFFDKVYAVGLSLWELLSFMLQPVRVGIRGVARLLQKSTIQAGRRVMPYTEPVLRRVAQFGFKHEHHIHRIHETFRTRVYRACYQASLLLLVVVTVVQFMQPVAQATMKDVRYDLSADATSLIGPSAEALKSQLVYNAQAQAYEYNAGYTPNDSAITNAGGAYQATLNEDASQGVTVTDPMARINVTFTPEFATSSGKQADGRVIYPLSDVVAGQMVYTVKGGGLKEDLVLNQDVGDTLSFSYKMKLPDGVIAKLLPDGNIGIYSGDPVLFGNISYGSDADKARVKLAREKAPKTNLVFTIPQPIVKEYGRGTSVGRAKFALTGSELTVTASNLSKATYPLSIDPTVTVNSASTFAQGSYEDNVNVDANGSTLDRGAVTGGLVHANTDQTVLTTGLWGACSVVYNGRIYVAGGTNGNTDQTAVYFNTIDASTGTVGGTWSTTGLTALPATRTQLACVIYNGYFYAIGGQLAGSATGTQNVAWHEISPIDGTMRGAWTTTGSVLATVGIYGAAAAAYNNRLYVAGGSNNGTPQTRVQMATFNGDGSISNFTSANMTVFPTARHALGMVIANDHMYIFGGDNDAATVFNTAYYAPITPSTGAVGAWTQASNMTSVLSEFSYAVYNNYIYVSAGCTALNNGIFGSSCGTDTTTSDYVQINADGSLGAWNTSNDSGSTARSYASGAIISATGTSNAAYFYTIGGCTGFALAACSGTSTEVGMGVINKAGWNNGWTPSGNSLNNARYGEGVIAYNGYIYAIGGCNAGNCSSILNTVERTQLASDGTMGIWINDATNTLPTAVYGITQGTTVYNGYIYVVGGCTNGSAACTAATNAVQIGAIQSNATVTWSTATGGTNPTISNSVYLNMATVAYGRLYSIGGIDTGSPATGHNNADVTTLNSDGSLAGFSAVTAPSVGGSSIYSAGIAVWGNYLYLAGGFQNGSASTAVWVAQITPSNGALTWNPSGTPASLPATITDGTAFVNKGYFYVSAGRSAGSLSGLVYSAVINPSTGYPSNYNSLAEVATVRAFGGMVTTADYMYLVGGCETNTICTTVSTKADYARIENGGNVFGAYGTPDTGTGTAGTHQYGATVVVGGYLFEIAGCTTSGTACSPTTTVNSVPIGPDGKLGAWAVANTLGDSRKEESAFVYNGKIYVLGGCNNGSCNNYVPTNHSVEVGTPNGAGNVTWVYNSNITGGFGSGSNLPNTVAGGDYMAYNGYVYRVGGIVGGTTSNSTAYAQIDSATGAILTWTVNSTQTLNTARAFAGAVAYNGYIYVVGGQDSSSNDLSSVEYTKIQSDHSLSGGWTVLTARLANARHGLVVDAANGMLMVAAGSAGTTAQTDVNVAAINADGTLGDFSKAGNLNTGRSDNGGFYYQGQLYIASGRNTSNTPLGSVEHASLNLQNRKGNYSKLADTDLDTRPLNFVFRGLLYNSVNQPLTWSYAMSTSASSAFGTPTATTGMVPETVYTMTPITGGVARYYWFRLSFDDTQSAVFPDSGNRTYVTNYDMYFNAATARRLRNGKTFTGQVQNNLDAHP